MVVLVLVSTGREARLWRLVAAAREACLILLCVDTADTGCASVSNVLCRPVLACRAKVLVGMLFCAGLCDRVPTNGCFEERMKC
jgi:hypothetical protein